MNDVHIDPWLHGGRGRLPDDARLVCAYDLYIGIDTLDEQVFFRRTATQDELWVDGIITGLAVRAPCGGEPPDACLRLFERLVRSRAGFGWPTGFQRAGLLSEAAFRRLMANLEWEMEGHAEAAESKQSEIVAMARQLDLAPETAGTGPNAWRARCPETHHDLHIDAETNTFFCGWRRRKGGPRELRAFVQERKHWRMRPQGT